MADSDIPAKTAARQSGLVWRVISAMVLAPVTLAAVHVGGAAFSALVAFCAVVMLFEWTRMIERRDFSAVFFTLAGGAAFSLFAAAAGRPLIALGLAAATAVAGAGLSAAISRRPRWTAFGALYIIVPSIALIWLRNGPVGGAALTMLLFLVVWAADTGGYLGGRLVGGPKMSPLLSPAKTWAGAVGGVLFGAAMGWAAARILLDDGADASHALIGAALGLASIVGDMAESACKRVFGVKDTSGFIPGHGGFLDRLDGMILATSALAAALILLMIIGGVEG